MIVEVFSDTVCPWCYVGKLRFERAVAQRTAAQPGTTAPPVRWLPYELNPDMPAEGADRADYLRARFGDVKRFESAQEQLREIGVDLGIDFRFDLIRRMPNTRRSHALIALAANAPDGGPSRQPQVKERILRAYFTEGRDIGDPEVLVEIAAEQGLDPEGVRASLDDQRLHAEIAQLEARARQQGIRGVPAFVFNRRHLVSGAQEPSIFVQVLDALAAQPGEASLA